MDVTHVFEELTLQYSCKGDPAVSTSLRACTVFGMKAERLRVCLTQFLEFCSHNWDDIAGYHSDLVWYHSCVDVLKFEEVSSSLVVSAAAELQDLQKMKACLYEDVLTEHARNYHNVILESLCELLKEVSSTLSVIKRERCSYCNISPFKLHVDPRRDKGKIKKMNETTSNFLQSSEKNEAEKLQNFAERYVSEVALPKQMATYKNFYEEHSELLSIENKELNEKFSSDLDEARLVERSVQSISHMLNDFSRILEEQSDHLNDVKEDSGATTTFIQDADRELLVTIERSKSSQRNMVIVTLGLSILLLILDYLTP